MDENEHESNEKGGEANSWGRGLSDRGKEHERNGCLGMTVVVGWAPCPYSEIPSLF